MRRLLFVAFSLTLIAGCRNESKSVVATDTTASATTTASAVQASLTPEQLGELGAAVAKQPENAQQLLSGRGLDEKSFEAQVRKVAEDPAASRRYAQSFKAASK